MMFTNLFGLPTFQAVELTAVIQRVAFLPSMLGGYGESLFVTSRSSSQFIAFNQQESFLSLIPTSPRGAPPVELEKRPGDMRIFRMHRLAKGSTLYADSLTGVLAGPEYAVVEAVQREFADRAARIRRDMEFTHEYMRFGAIMGRVQDADGSVLDDFWTTWGKTMPAWIEVPLDSPTAPLRAIFRDVIREAERTSKGGWVPGRTAYHALCGKDFFDKLITHPMVERLFLNYALAQDLMRQTSDVFEFGGIYFHDYHGTDDNLTMMIPPNEAHLFPVGGNEVFRTVWGPAEFEPWINQPGQDIYAITIPDRDRGAWMRWEGYCYPLYVCVRPEMLRRMKITGT